MGPIRVQDRFGTQRNLANCHPYAEVDHGNWGGGSGDGILFLDQHLEERSGEVAIKDGLLPSFVFISSHCCHHFLLLLSSHITSTTLLRNLDKFNPLANGHMNRFWPSSGTRWADLRCCKL